MLTKEKAKKTLILIFAGLIFLLLNFTYSIKIGELSISLAFASIIGLVLILVATTDARKYLKSANIGFYISIAALVCIFIPLLNLLILNNVQPQLSYLETIAKNMDLNKTDYDAINKIFSTIDNISGELVGMMAISTFPSAIALGAMIYYSGEMVNEICLQRGLFYSDKVKRNARLTTIFMVITNVLAFFAIWLLLEGISKIRIDVETEKVIMSSVGSLGFGMLLLLPLIAIAISYLVFFIKLIVNISRVIDDNNKKTDDNSIQTERDIIDNE